MNILLTAKQRGSTNALAPVAEELNRRSYWHHNFITSKKHYLTIYATGNETEAAGFEGLNYKHIHPTADDFDQLVKGYDAVIVGLSGYNTPDSYFLRAANSAGIPTIAILDQNTNYQKRLGKNPADLPTIIAVMDKGCIETAKKDLSDEIREEAIKRMKVVGWTAFDHYTKIREDFTEKDKIELLTKLDIAPENLISLYCSQNIYPETNYIIRNGTSFDDWAPRFNYEMGLTRFVFEAASDLGLKLVVRPHPGEEFKRNYTKELADWHNFIFIPTRSCDLQQLILASYSVAAGRNTCLTEATLLDRNTGGLVPDLGEEWINPFPPMSLGAIPYTQSWEGIKDVLEQINSKDGKIVKELAENRKKFSVNGKASKRLADLIEEIGG